MAICLALVNPQHPPLSLLINRADHSQFTRPKFKPAHEHVFRSFSVKLGILKPPSSAIKCNCDFTAYGPDHRNGGHVYFIPVALKQVRNCSRFLEILSVDPSLNSQL